MRRTPQACCPPTVTTPRSSKARAACAFSRIQQTRRYDGVDGAGRYPDQGGDAQSPDGDLAVSGSGYRLGRRDSRRGRDRHRRQAQGGLTGFSVSNLRIPGFVQPWEADFGKPDRIASARDIMISAPLGAAAFNNEFGRPATCGYFRTFEQADEATQRAGPHGARLSQAHHDRGRPGQYSPQGCGEARGRGRRTPGGARAARRC